MLLGGRNVYVAVGLGVGVLVRAGLFGGEVDVLVDPTKVPVGVLDATSVPVKNNVPVLVGEIAETDSG